MNASNKESLVLNYWSNALTLMHRFFIAKLSNSFDYNLINLILAFQHYNKLQISMINLQVTYIWHPLQELNHISTAQSSAELSGTRKVLSATWQPYWTQPSEMPSEYCKYQYYCPSWIIGTLEDKLEDIAVMLVIVYVPCH
jgi:hypothetical protein